MAMNIGSSCKGCIYNIRNLSDEQCECKMGILENIRLESKVFELVDGDYQFDRVCPLKDTDKSHTGSISLDRFIKFHFVVHDTDLEGTIRTLDSIKPLIQKDTRLCVVTSDNFRAITDLFDSLENVYIVNSYDEIDREAAIDECFQKMHNGYTVVLGSGETITNKDLNKVDDFITRRMKRVALVEDAPFVINNVLFKALKGNKQGSFKDKLETLCEQQTIKSMTYTWGKINEALS
jgi:hypothetical protein